MNRDELHVKKRDLRDITLGAFGGFLLLLLPLATRDLGAAILVGFAFGVPGGALGATLACLLQRYRQAQ